MTLVCFRECTLTSRHFERRIIDLLYYQWVEFDGDLTIGQTLLTCSLVCKAWRNQVQQNLSKPTTICYDKLLSFSDTLRNNDLASFHITGLTITMKSEAVPISPFAAIHRLPSLSYLSIEQLDLSREHKWLDRAPLFHSVRALYLSLQQSQLPQLIRFINSFLSLSELELYFTLEKLEYKGQILPKPFNINNRSLKWLTLHLIPGVSRLIDWLIGSKSLLAELETLILYTGVIECEDELRSSFHGVERLLYHCRTSVEDLRLYLENSTFVEDVSDLCKHIPFDSEILLTCPFSPTQSPPKTHVPNIWVLLDGPRASIRGSTASSVYPHFPDEYHLRYRVEWILSGSISLSDPR